MDIEEIAAKNPDALIHIVVEPAVGMQSFQAREIAFRLGLSIKQVQNAPCAPFSAPTAPSAMLDATMLEINPLVLTA